MRCTSARFAALISARRRTTPPFNSASDDHLAPWLCATASARFDRAIYIYSIGTTAAEDAGKLHARWQCRGERSQTRCAEFLLVWELVPGVAWTHHAGQRKKRRCVSHVEPKATSFVERRPWLVRCTGRTEWERVHDVRRSDHEAHWNR